LPKKPADPMSNKAAASDERWIDLAYRSLTLEERLGFALNRSEPGPAKDQANQVLQDWAKAFSPGEPETFARRLSWDDLDEDAVVRAFSWDEIPAGEFADWTQWLSSTLHEAARLAPRGSATNDLAFGEQINWEGEDHPPFIEIWIPALKAARQVLDDSLEKKPHWLTSEARACFDKQLIRELASISELILFKRFKKQCQSDRATGTDPRAAYMDFVLRMFKGGLVELFSELPVLARMVGIVMECWVGSTCELLERLERDHQEIAESFAAGLEIGRLVHVEPALSDPHHGRRRVASLHFDSQVTVIYKPRDVRIEKAYNDFLDWAMARGLQCPRPLKVVLREGYGWVEAAQHDDAAHPEIVRRYFERSGVLLCIAHLLRGRDFHMENVIATPDGPVLVDPEMLFQPDRGTEEPEPDEAAYQTDDPGPSCLETGLLSIIQAGPDGQVYDIGGLWGTGSVQSELRRRVWKNHGTSELHYVESTRSERPLRNRIRCSGQPQEPSSFADEIASGFVSAYRFFMANRDDILRPDGPLSVFKDSQIRFLIRPSHHYAIATQVLAEPQYQKSGVKRSILLEALHRGFARQEQRPVLWPIARIEKSDLQKLDIPRFTVGADDVDLRVPEADVLRNFYVRSGMDSVAQRFRHLDEDDLAFQARTLARALWSSVGSYFVTPVSPSMEEALTKRSESLRSAWIPIAQWVGEEILAWREKRDERGELARFGLDSSPESGPREFHLYNGSLGEGVFFGALATITGDPAWRENALQVVEPLFSMLENEETRAPLESENLGACSGIASIVHGLGLLGDLIADDALTDLALRFSRYLTKERIAVDTKLDIVDGVAGAALVCSALGERTQDRRLRQLVAACGERLVEVGVPMDKGTAWPTCGGRFLAGFAHGAAGIALALARAYDASGKRDFLVAARNAYAYERSVFSPALGNWPIVGSSGDGPRDVVMTAWCHGAPGIVLGRALARETLEDDQVLEEIEIGMKATSNASSQFSDHLCCGTLGRSDVMLTVGHRLERKDAITAAEKMARVVVHRALRMRHFRLRSSGFHYPIHSSGFFRGLSGIGYLLLRLAEPIKLPSVLAFDSIANGESPDPMKERL
jgi:type 2 lantibiotic biosynthesis protein LanM